MKLFKVYDCGYDWVCFVFAKDRNRARQLVAKWLDTEYIQMLACIVAKETDIEIETVVDTEEHSKYKDVVRYGEKYEEEYEL